MVADRPSLLRGLGNTVFYFPGKSDSGNGPFIYASHVLNIYCIEGTVKFWEHGEL